MSQTQTLYEYLLKNDFYIEKSLAELIEKVIMSSSRKAFLLRGPAGTGKTQLTYLISQWLQATYVFYQCTYGTSEDDLLYKYIPSEQTKSGIKLALGPIPRALAESKNHKVVLVLDEFDKTRPSADALLLDVLQNFRVALYLDDNETTVTGNPENLVVFLTSNDMREFSEPLLRRAITIMLRSLPTTKVLEILSKRFKKEIALLLAQIYDDTIQAGLRKPATIQELYQLGEVLEVGTSIALEDLVRMFVIKYDDDWEKFRQYIVSRKLFQFFEQKREEDIAKHYEPQEQEIEIPQQNVQQQAEASTSVEQLLQKISVVVRQPQRMPEAREEVKEDREVAFKANISENDVTMYTMIVKKLKPEPTETGDIMGKFRVVKSVNEYNIISEKPLTLREYIELAKDTSASFEAYIEDKVIIVNPTIINKLLEEADKVYYYSKRVIRAEKEMSGIRELVEIEMLSGDYHPSAESQIIEAIVRSYAKVEPHSYSRSIPLLNIFTFDYICRLRAEDTKMRAEEVAKLVSICMESNKNLSIVVKADVENVVKALKQRFEVDAMLNQGNDTVCVYKSYNRIVVRSC